MGKFSLSLPLSFTLSTTSSTNKLKHLLFYKGSWTGVGKKCGSIFSGEICVNIFGRKLNFPDLNFFHLIHNQFCKHTLLILQSHGQTNKFESILSEEICVNYLGRNLGKFSLYLPLSFTLSTTSSTNKYFLFDSSWIGV